MEIAWLISTVLPMVFYAKTYREAGGEGEGVELMEKMKFLLPRFQDPLMGHISIDLSILNDVEDLFQRKKCWAA